jgi:3-hydroxyacyl-CoA dehydrogenase
MYKTIAFLKRKAGMSREAFIDYYESKHVPLILSIAPQVCDYRRSFLVEEGAILYPGAGPVDFDVVTELWYPDRAAYEAALALFTKPENAAAIARDEENFLERARTRFYVAEERRTRPAAPHVKSLPQAVAEPPGLAPGTPARTIERAAVIGAGVMGAGIVTCFANAGIPVVLLDRKPGNLERALQAVRASYAGALKRGAIQPDEVEQRLACVSTTLREEDLSDADLVVEAIAEDLDAKRALFARLGRLCRPGAILATNTSFLDLDVIAAATGRPGDVLGLHFFNPAHVMKLLEVVRGAATTPDVQATGMVLARRLGKTGVLVGACPGFVGNRMLARRSREALFMLEEGALPWEVDAALVDFGFALGPFAVNDLGGLDVVLATRRARWATLTERARQCTLLEQLVAQGRLGRKTGAGWYAYDERRQPQQDQAVEALVRAHSQARGITRRAIGAREIVERCVFAMVNEGARLIESGIVSRPHEIDAVWLFGMGFPQQRGGPMFHADQVGLDTVHAALERYAREIGKEYFAPAPLIGRLARAGRGFYGS